MKGWYKALEDLVWLTQLGLNMLLPLVMCLGGAWWAVNSWSWPEWATKRIRNITCSFYLYI